MEIVNILWAAKPSDLKARFDDLRIEPERLQLTDKRVDPSELNWPLEMSQTALKDIELPR